MATPSQPNNPSGNTNVRQTVGDLESLKKSQGDYNNLLKDSINLLKQMDRQYDSLEGRLESMSKNTVNVKQIEREIEKAKTKQYVVQKQLSRLEEEVGEKGKKNIESYLQLTEELADMEKQMLKAKRSGNTSLYETIEKQFNIYSEQLETQKESLTTGEASLIGLREANRLSEESMQFAKQKLKEEQDIRKNIGFTGAAMGFLADKLGLGASYQEDLVEKAKELQKIGQKLTFGDKILALGKASLGALTEVFKDPLAFAMAWKAVSAGFDKLGGGMKKVTGAFVEGDGPITKVAGTFSGMLKSIPMFGGLIAGIVDSFAMLLDFAVGAKSQIQEMGRQIGLSADESVALSNHYHDFSISTGKAYLNNKVLLKTQIDMNKELGITNKISDANVQTAFELMKFAGIELDTVTKIEQVSKITGKSQSSIAGAVMHQVNNFKKLTGVGLSFQGIMKEVANLSGYLGLRLTKYPGEIIKSVVAAKGLGLELKQLDSMADGFLDVEGSIAKEMEAQVLTGRDINLNRARELFLNNQLVEAGAELSKQLGSSEDFLRMNRIEATSLSEAMGMSRDQVADMLKQQEYMAAFGAGSVKELQKKVALMKEQGRAQEAINKLGSEEAFNKLVASSATEDLSGFIEKIKESFAALVSNTKLADMVQNFIQFLSKPENITKILNKIKDVFGTIVSIVGAIMGGIMRAVNVIVGLFSDFQIDEGMINMVEGAGAQIKSFDMGNLVGSAPKLGDNVVKAQTTGGGTVASQPAAQGFGGAREIKNTIILQADGRELTTLNQSFNEETPGIDGQRVLNSTPGVSKARKK